MPMIASKQMTYTSGMRNDEGGAEQGVACRLFVDGRVIAFVLPGRLVTMPAKTPRKGKEAKRP